LRIIWPNIHEIPCTTFALVCENLAWFLLIV
jgi:hypothetical protein